MKADDIKTGYAIIDKKLCWIRKITDHGVVCYHVFGRGGNCEKIDSFLKRDVTFPSLEEAADIRSKQKLMLNTFLKKGK